MALIVKIQEPLITGNSGYRIYMMDDDGVQGRYEVTMSKENPKLLQRRKLGDYEAVEPIFEWSEKFFQEFLESMLKYAKDGGIDVKQGRMEAMLEAKEEGHKAVIKVKDEYIGDLRKLLFKQMKIEP